MRGVVTLSRLVVVCIGLTGCAAASDPGGPGGREGFYIPRRQMLLSDGAGLKEERLDCPVGCARHGNLVRCRAECPPLATETPAR